ncbi:hypothetical protein [Microbacterium sp.]|jgi:hypothetical protein|uniref:hypothetical protein n=1 Tax=Microbacterium sp. TaxID=51671 RepID=UPI0025D99268|nr:hypothetical protein [Microbacterium sp.]MBT9607136.1 hypothetical protein [Microbacterium sp.]
MSTARLPRHRRRTAAIVVASIALIGPALLLAWVGYIEVTVSGASGMIAVLPMGLFWLTSWVWGVLAFVALGLGATSPRPALPCLLAVAALLEIVLGFAVLGVP